MKKLFGIAISSVVLIIGAFSSITGDLPSVLGDKTADITGSSPDSSTIVKATRPTCNGTTVNTNCELDGINYIKYAYHPAVQERSHTETITTYEEKIVGYCTLCNDGTYSPSCATGRGACSWHGGVAQWNAPKYTNVPVYISKKVVDAPAKEAYYEKVKE